MRVLSIYQRETRPKTYDKGSSLTPGGKVFLLRTGWQVCGPPREERKKLLHFYDQQQVELETQFLSVQVMQNGQEIARAREREQRLYKCLANVEWNAFLYACVQLYYDMIGTLSYHNDPSPFLIRKERSKPERFISLVAVARQHPCPSGSFWSVINSINLHLNGRVCMCACMWVRA